MHLPFTLTHKLGLGLALLTTLAASVPGHSQPGLPNDAAVEAVYTLDQLPLMGGPHVVRALVRNVGSSIIPAGQQLTLEVAGVTSFTTTATMGSLPASASVVVSFPAFVPAAAGPQSLLVTLGNDDDTSNNTVIVSQEVTAATASYITPGVGNSSLGFQGGTSAFVAKFEADGPHDVVAVRAFIADVNSIGQTVFAVVADPTTGNLLGRTPDYVVTSADVGTVHTFALSPAVPVPGGSYLAGMAQVTNPGRNFFPMGTQTERPTRPDTFFGLGITVPNQPYDLGQFNYGKLMLETVLVAPATCPSPRNLSVSTTQNTATITFTGPPNATGYELVYGPAGFNPASSGTTLAAQTSPLTVTGLAPTTSYDFYLRAICSPTDQSTLVGPLNAATLCVPPIITALPYAQDFNTLSVGQGLPCGVQVRDANGDANTWRARATVNTQANPNLPIGRGGSGNAMVYFYNTNDNTVGADDWFFLPALRLTGGQAYALSFYYRSAGAAYPEGLEVSYGNAAIPAAQTNRLFTNLSVGNPAYVLASGNTAPRVSLLTPASTGTYYIGFHAVSAADQYYLAVDDVDLALVLGTSKALAQAVSVFPNPSPSGRFSLQVQGADAPGALSVEVTNVLGQVVYAGSARDNFTSEVDLSGQAAGLYTLKVKAGEQYITRQLSIVH